MIASLLKMTWVCKSPAYASSHASLRCRRILSGILLSWRKYSQVWKTTCQISQAYLHSVWKSPQNVLLIKSVKYLNFRAKMGQKQFKFFEKLLGIVSVFICGAISQGLLWYQLLWMWCRIPKSNKREVSISCLFVEASFTPLMSMSMVHNKRFGHAFYHVICCNGFCFILLIKAYVLYKLRPVCLSVSGSLTSRNLSRYDEWDGKHNFISFFTIFTIIHF